ncbi:NAD(P)-dependent dehydrogenase, short-chain alcohol dehydrogenase family [Azospirillum oryzae]|uniref:NAD(P)-dependent dehydrogenase, short-chain alcohol dehydrogenase family n=1 Tax=Azospirillum oryzae TaxID=286727 RepID=A0A1X7GWY3_9PROT|nr:SDR family oxidoreductase [Azospirillum oryzae]SMF75855.1 NAD(P)-dependent dehydrogenase, short-chain alcohol dehydrogenase family [Azospirillum oryzae]
MRQLDGKIAIVTGASSGIGREAALLFAEHGAKLVLVARRRDELERLADEISGNGGDAVAVAGNVAEAETAREAVEVATRQFGGLDVAFNNAGTTGAMVSIPEMTAEMWHEVIATNLTSAFHAAKHQIPAMLTRGGGSLIFTSTFVGHTVGFPGMAAYAASKAGLIGLTQVIAAEYGPQGIRANALLPGGTDTPMGRAVSNTPEALAFVQGLHALKRLATPREIAQSALYLASGMSSFTTGTTLLVDGGVSITRT